VPKSLNNINRFYKVCTSVIDVQTPSARLPFLKMLVAFQEAHIDSMLIKDSAPCNQVYSDSGLRPMRDIDILVRGDDVPAAETLLIENGVSA